jgi:hypothetical protein
MSFLTGFDTYPAVARNTILPVILDEISVSLPPPAPLARWSLDALFILPYQRLRYYRKLYARLLRNTKEGRSDHRMLVSANQRLDVLVSDAEARLEFDVNDEDQVPDDTGAARLSDSHDNQSQHPRERSWAEREKERASRASSAMGSSSRDSQAK